MSIFDLTPEIAARYTEDAPDFHANEAETSMLLHLAEDQVRLERAVDEPDRTVGRVLSYPMPAVTRSGVVGTPSAATACAAPSCSTSWWSAGRAARSGAGGARPGPLERSPLQRRGRDSNLGEPKGHNPLSRPPRFLFMQG